VGAAAGRVRFGIACLADTVLIGTERWRRKENGRGGCGRRERGVSRLRRRKVSGYWGVVIGNRKRKGEDEWGGECFQKGRGRGRTLMFALWIHVLEVFVHMQIWETT
jgi:hypothetical protein